MLRGHWLGCRAGCRRRGSHCVPGWLGVCLQREEELLVTAGLRPRGEALPEECDALPAGLQCAGRAAACYLWD